MESMEDKIINLATELQRLWASTGRKEMLHITVQHDYIDVWAYEDNSTSKAITYVKFLKEEEND